MAVPTITSLSPSAGTTLGRSLVRIQGTNFTDRVQVTFGSAAPQILGARHHTLDEVNPQTPDHSPGAVDVIVVNLDASDLPIVGESVTVVGGYTFTRPDLTAETLLTRTVRMVRRRFADHVLENTIMRRAPDFVLEGALIEHLPTDELPVLFLSLPELERNRIYNRSPREYDETGQDGLEEVVSTGIRELYDLSFRITAVTQSILVLTNLQTALTLLFNRLPKLSVPKDLADLGAGSDVFEFVADGEADPQGTGDDGQMVLFWGCVVRAVPIDDGEAKTTTARFETTDLSASAL